MDQFVRYISAHLQESVSRDWTVNVGSARAIELVARYCPEISQDTCPPTDDHATCARPLTFGELKEVPELAEFARRMVRLNLKKQQTWSNSPSNRPIIKPVIDAEKYRRTYDKAFRAAIRLLCKAGDIVECDLPDSDVRQISEARRKRKKVADTTLSSPVPNSKRRTLRDVSNLSGSISSVDEEDEVVEIEVTGYLPLSLPILGPIILQVLCSEVIRRKDRYIPKGDSRRENGITVVTIAARLKKMASRWERLPHTIIEDGLSDLVDIGLVQVWGVGFWPADETTMM